MTPHGFPKEVSHIAFAGDWHGNAQWAKEVIAQLPEEVEVLIHLGDFGYNFEESYLNSVNRAAKDANILVMFVDGNHENFTTLYSYELEDEGFRVLRPRVWHLPRNFRWEWGGVKFMALGGAHSVDSRARIPFLSWWPEETISYKEYETALMSGPVDVMVTHDAPAGHHIPGLMPDGYFPDDEIRKADGHRALLKEIVDEVKPKLIWHGHYHSRYTETTDYGTIIVGMDCDRTSYNKNIDVVDIATIKEIVDSVDNGQEV